MSLRVGYFPQNNSLWVLRHRGILERAVPDVEWVNLRSLPRERVDPTSGLPSAHGDHLFDGGYDFIGTGSTPPVTAQAKGHDVVYVAISGPRHENGRLVVRDDSPIRSVSDLARQAGRARPWVVADHPAPAGAGDGRAELAGHRGGGHLRQRRGAVP